MSIKNFSISRQINENFKDYAIYTIRHRGIPEFEDSLTNVQRLILLSAKKHFAKTLTLVGDVIASGNYHHGNASLEKAINRLARPYNIGDKILEGDGFFGTHVNPMPAASRYTSVKINPEISNLISKYNHLNKKTDDEILPLNIDIPVGLLLPVIGIAVGFTSLILPRKLKDITDFMNGKTNECKPHITNFPDSKIQKIEDNIWLFHSTVDVDEKLQIINISNVPPMMSYSGLVKKLDKIIENISQNIDIVNNSKDEVNISIKMKPNKNSEDFQDLLKKIVKATSIIVQEKITFVYQGKVIQYANIEDYLKDFKFKNNFVVLRNLEYLLAHAENELKYNECRLLFLKFMFGAKRTNADIAEFFKSLKVNKDSLDRLMSIKASHISKEEIIETELEIKKLNNLIIENKKSIVIQNDIINTSPSEMHNKVVNYGLDLEDEVEYSGVEIFKFEDEAEDEHD